MGVRKLSAGKFRCEFMFDGRRYSKTMPSAEAARAWENKTKNSLVQGTYLDTQHNGLTVGEYGRTWIQHRNLKETTRQDYLETWGRYVEPAFGKIKLRNLSQFEVRQWRSELPGQIAKAAQQPNVTGETASAYAYRILKAVMNTAVSEQLILRNPCQVVGGGKPKNAKQRKALPIEKLPELMAVINPRYKVLVYLLVVAGLRIGEATALQRSDFNLNPNSPTVEVSRRVKQRRGGGWSWDTPKSEASKQIKRLPADSVPLIQEHLYEYALPGFDGLVFVTKQAQPAVEAGSRAIKKALRQMGYDELVAHSLRHTAGTEAAKGGTALKDLQQFLGHKTATAALIYQHQTEPGQIEIASKFENVIPLRQVANG